MGILNRDIVGWGGALGQAGLGGTLVGGLKQTELRDHL